MTDEALVRQIAPLVEQIKPILAGKAPEVQGATLADCVALWLAGHVRFGDPVETNRFREELLSEFINVVRELIPINAKQLGTEGD